MESAKLAFIKQICLLPSIFHAYSKCTRMRIRKISTSAQVFGRLVTKLAKLSTAKLASTKKLKYASEQYINTNYLKDEKRRLKFQHPTSAIDLWDNSNMAHVDKILDLRLLLNCLTYLVYAVYYVFLDIYDNQVML